MKMGYPSILLVTLGIMAIADANPVDSAVSNRVQPEDRVMVCYYGTWAVYRPGKGKFDVEDIDVNICTHVVYGFACLRQGKIAAYDPWNDLYDNYGKGAYLRFTGLKQQNPALKTILAIGGWNEGSSKYSDMAKTKEGRATFIQSCVEFLQEYGFDGLDLDWEYPSQRGGAPEDKVNFGLLLDEMRPVFNKHGLLMTAATSPGKQVIDPAYDMESLARNLDIMNLMAYDYHGAWDNFAHVNTPMYQHHLDVEEPNIWFNVDYTLQYYLSLGFPANKIALGTASYGRCFTLQKAENHEIYDSAPQAGAQGPYTREPGILGYNEICEKFMQQSWTVVRDAETMVPYCFSDRQWCGYDDLDSLTIKINYAIQNDLLGAMIWSIETDDFHGTCHDEAFPLIRHIRRQLLGGGDVTIPTPPTLPPTTTTTRDPSAPTEPPTTTKPSLPTLPPTEVCHREGLNVDPDDCHSFYECHQVGGSWEYYHFQCSAGTVFVEDMQLCDFEDQHPELC